MIVFKISLLVWCLVSVSVAVGSIAISLPRKILALVFVSPVFFISFSNIPDPPSFRFGTFYSIQVWGLDDWQLFFFCWLRQRRACDQVFLYIRTQLVFVTFRVVRQVANGKVIETRQWLDVTSSPWCPHTHTHFCLRRT